MTNLFTAIEQTVSQAEDLFSQQKYCETQTQLETVWTLTGALDLSDVDLSSPFGILMNQAQQLKDAASSFCVNSKRDRFALWARWDFAHGDYESAVLNANVAITFSRKIGDEQSDEIIVSLTNLIETVEVKPFEDKMHFYLDIALEHMQEKRYQSAINAYNVAKGFALRLDNEHTPVIVDYVDQSVLKARRQQTHDWVKEWFSNAETYWEFSHLDVGEKIQRSQACLRQAVKLAEASYMPEGYHRNIEFFAGQSDGCHKLHTETVNGLN